jgi:hypothetical protein
MVHIKYQYYDQSEQTHKYMAGKVYLLSCGSSAASSFRLEGKKRENKLITEGYNTTSPIRATQCINTRTNDRVLYFVTNVFKDNIIIPSENREAS